MDGWEWDHASVSATEGGGRAGRGECLIGKGGLMSEGKGPKGRSCCRSLVVPGHPKHGMTKSFRHHTT